MSEHPSPAYNLPDTGDTGGAATEAAEVAEAAEAVIEAAAAAVGGEVGRLWGLRLWRLLWDRVQMGLLNRSPRQVGD